MGAERWKEKNSVSRPILESKHKASRVLVNMEKGGAIVDLVATRNFEMTEFSTDRIRH